MTSSSEAQDDLGPALPPRGEVYATAVELHTLARLAMEFSMAGKTCDLRRAVEKLDRMRVVLGLMTPLGMSGGGHG